MQILFDLNMAYYRRGYSYLNMIFKWDIRMIFERDLNQGFRKDLNRILNKRFK